MDILAVLGVVDFLFANDCLKLLKKSSSAAEVEIVEETALLVLFFFAFVFFPLVAAGAEDVVELFVDKKLLSDLRLETFRASSFAHFEVNCTTCEENAFW